MIRPDPIDAVLAVASRCELGEGILWCDRRAAWLWTDIESARLWSYRPADGAVASWRLPDRTGCLALCESGRLLLGLAKGLAIADLDGTAPGELVPVAALTPVETALATTRLNDGRVDRAGRFVFGTFNEAAPHPPLGGFYQYSPVEGLRPLDLGPVAIANSLCFSPDGGTLYFCDSPTRRILCADYDSAGARVSNVREFVRVEAETGGMPDGSIVDADGYLWNAVWGGARIQRYAPDGRPDVRIDLPVPNVTCLAFGGPDLDDLLITSARMGMAPAALARTPEAGGLFRAARAGARGLPDTRLAGA